MTAKARTSPAKLLPTYICLAALILTLGCASTKYMLDDPVNDPIMTTDDQQDSDLGKVEDGGYGGAGGECPT